VYYLIGPQFLQTGWHGNSCKKIKIHEEFVKNKKFDVNLILKCQT